MNTKDSSRKWMWWFLGVVVAMQLYFVRELLAAFALFVLGFGAIAFVLGALYMLLFAQRFLFGATKAPHQPLFDLEIREKAILATIVVAVFALGLFPAEPLRKTELAARDFQQRVAAERTGTPVAAREKPDLAVSRVALPGSGAAKTGDIR